MRIVFLAVLAATAASGADWSAMPRPAAGDFDVVTQDGRRVRFFADLVGNRTVAINFIFTSCRAVCPAASAAFARLGKQLDEQRAENTRLISVSVDPVRDTPSVLREYAAGFHGPAAGRWNLVTGDPAVLRRLVAVLTGSGSAVPTLHVRGVAVIAGAAGKWTWLTESNSPAQLAAVLAEAERLP